MAGTERIMANSAGDWGKSNPLAVPEFILEMRRRGHPEESIHKLVYDNPLTFFRQSVRWNEWETADVKASIRSDSPSRLDRIRSGG
jgi:hypothetical protein